MKPEKVKIYVKSILDKNTEDEIEDVLLTIIKEEKNSILNRAITYLVKEKFIISGNSLWGQNFIKAVTKED